MDNIANNIQQIKSLLKGLRESPSRIDNNITILAASKGQNPEKLSAAWQSGIRCFGENYLQEALKKIETLSEIDPEWHFIGPVQTNKTRQIARYFHWVHTVDRLRIAARLSKHREGNTHPLNICIQVNIDGSASKSGVKPENLLELANNIVGLPHLKLRGLMVLPEPATSEIDQRKPFGLTAKLLSDLKNSSPSLNSLDTLSMGTSNDLKAAIAEGATIIRIGTGIFGPRQTEPQRQT
jgi:hypothetical protein